MNASFRDTLARMQEAEAVATVAVVDADGMIIAGLPEGSAELESISASAGGTRSFLASLGAEAEVGETTQATIEYAEGTIFPGPIDSHSFLLVITEAGAPLGQVRLILRRYRSELAQQLSQVWARSASVEG